MITTWSSILRAVEMEKDKTEGYLTRKNQNYLDVGDNKKEISRLIPRFLVCRVDRLNYQVLTHSDLKYTRTSGRKY